MFFSNVPFSSRRSDKGDSRVSKSWVQGAGFTVEFRRQGSGLRVRDFVSLEASQGGMKVGGDFRQGKPGKDLLYLPHTLILPYLEVHG